MLELRVDGGDVGQAALGKVGMIYDEAGADLRLVQCGIDSMSVNPDTVKFTKKMVAQVEQRLILDQLTGRGRNRHEEELAW